MRAVPTWVDKVHDRDRNEQVIMYLFNLFCNAQCRWKIQKIGGTNNTYEYVICRSMHVILVGVMAPSFVFWQMS